MIDWNSPMIGGLIAWAFFGLLYFAIAHLLVDKKVDKIMASLKRGG